MAMIDEGATAIVEMLFCTSLVALVSAGDKPSASPRRLQIVNTKASLDVQASLSYSLAPTILLIVRSGPCLPAFDSLATIDHLRTLVSYSHPRRPDEQEEVGSRPRTRDLHLRHFDYEALAYA